MIFSRLKKYLVAALVVLLTSLGLTAITQAEALDGSKFDPGLIISDSVFFDFGTMTASEIQRFLETQVPVCKSGSNGMPCLRNYKADTPEKAADPGKCAYMPAQTNISAAQIIANISKACGINPRVLLVTLQKEQGLVQATIPSSYMYRAAMGYGCPDSDPGICGKVWTGLFNQLYKAAGQFQWYGDPNGSFTYLRPGRQVSISYHPTASRNCGKSSFLLKSQATANLYYYTPFTPNAAALSNLRGTGDSCSSYGNRNFWRFYWDWFGSPIGGGFLLKSATSDPYFISNDVKYPLSDPALAKELAPLGPLGEISKEYLDSFATGTPMTRLIKTAAVGGVSTYFFISGGKKYLVPGCEQATNMGLDCTKAVQLTQVQLDALPTGQFRPDVTAVVKSKVVAPEVASYFMISQIKKYPLDCTKAANLGVNCSNAVEYSQAQLDALPTVRLSSSTLGISPLLTLDEGIRVFISDGKKREVLDAASLTAAGVPATAPSPLKIKDYSYLPWGEPIALDGSLFLNRGLKRQGLLFAGNVYDIDPATAADVDFTKTFRLSTGTLGGGGLSQLPQPKVLTTLIVDEAAQYWLLNKEGKTKVTDSSDWIEQATPVSQALADKFLTSTAEVTGFNYIQAFGQKTIYLLKDGVLRATFNESDREKLGQTMSATEPVRVALSSLSLIPKSVMVLPNGLAVQNRTTKVTGIIDGPTRMVTFGETSMKLTLPAFRSMSNLQLAGYPNQETLNSHKVSCSGQIYAVANSLLHEIPISLARELPGRSTALSDSTCAQLTITDKKFGYYIGQKILNPVTKKYSYRTFKISRGTKLPFRNLSDYKLDNKSGIPLVWVDDTFLKNLPLGNQVVVAGAIVTEEVKPNLPVVPKTYTTVAGDSLSSIAARFGLTVAKLMSLNGIVNADRISVGQVLRLS